MWRNRHREKAAPALGAQRGGEVAAGGRGGGGNGEAGVTGRGERRETGLRERERGARRVGQWSKGEVSRPPGSLARDGGIVL